MKASASVGHLTIQNGGQYDALTDESVKLVLDVWVERLQALQRLYALDNGEDHIKLTQAQSQFFALTKGARGVTAHSPLVVMQPLSVLSILQGATGTYHLGAVRMTLHFDWLPPSAAITALEEMGLQERAGLMWDWFEGCAKAAEGYVK